MPVSDSCAEDMTFAITLLFTCIGALSGGGVSFGPMGNLGLLERKKYPPPRERALGSLR